MTDSREGNRVVPAIPLTGMFAIAFVACSIAISGCAKDRESSVVVGSKSFTESIILGEIATQLVQSTGSGARHRADFGGTRILFTALQDGQLDIYPEYTGTLIRELLHDQNVSDLASIRRALEKLGLCASDPLGFNNTYALAMRREAADRLQIKRISDLTKHTALRFGFSNEFMNRGDGWPSLQRAYGLPQKNVRGMQHAVAYAGLAGGGIDVIDVYTTDPEILFHDLAILEDDLTHFPRYDALWLYRADLLQRHPDAVTAIKRLCGEIDDRLMTTLNAEARPKDLSARISEARVAASFLEEKYDFQTTLSQKSRLGRIGATTLDHLRLVLPSLAAAILIAIPLGIVASKYALAGQVILAVTGMLQTIPSLALLVLLIPPLTSLGWEIGFPQAVVALCLYSLLPIVRNTVAGFRGIPIALRESAEALGLTAAAKLGRIELPLALPTILAGIKTAAILNIGFATLGALIGAGGYGQPILTGIRLADNGRILEGAIPAAVMALLAQGLFEIVERWVVPRGLRLQPGSHD
ncbi:MAG: glycine betaine ABC transporter substrate-binding protein [Phycisphaerae bacterium]